MARYMFGGLVLHRLHESRFPWSTLAVNLLGCLAIGAMAGVIEKHHVFKTELRLLLIVGLLGGFTTFSAFGFETVYLLKRAAWSAALLNVAASVLGGLAAVWLAMTLSEQL